MRLCSVWDPGAGRRRLCVVSSGDVAPVGTHNGYADVSELIARRAGSLEEAVAAAGVAPSLGRFEEAAAADLTEGNLHLVAPVTPDEVWAAGVTYELSRDARMHESTDGDIYARVYESERPELFLKATGSRVVGPGAPVGLRSDSSWQIPEPEIALVLRGDGEIAGYTLGNDMSSRDIEGDNPLFLPQAKIFAGSCALGPMVVSSNEIEDPYSQEIEMQITRSGDLVFSGSTSTARLRKRFDVLIAYLKRDNWIAPGTVLLTGTGVVPPDDFTLQPGDVVDIVSPAIGSLRNRCEAADGLATPRAWSG
jgi:2-dehydro-3-deoxy-D-arabinonate dehydratase